MEKFDSKHCELSDCKRTLSVPEKLFLLFDWDNRIFHIDIWSNLLDLLCHFFPSERINWRTDVVLFPRSVLIRPFLVLVNKRESNNARWTTAGNRHKSLANKFHPTINHFSTDKLFFLPIHNPSCDSAVHCMTPTKDSSFGYIIEETLFAVNCIANVVCCWRPFGLYWAKWSMDCKTCSPEVLRADMQHELSPLEQLSVRIESHRCSRNRSEMDRLSFDDSLTKNSLFFRQNKIKVRMVHG